MTCGCGETKDWCVKRGATFVPTIRWAQKTLATAAITAITQATPVVITAPNHGLPSGWPAAVVGANGMNFINAPDYPPELPDLHAGTVIDANTVAFNDVSSALWYPYIAPGGALVYYTPQPLSGVTFTMGFYDTPEMNDTPLVTLTNGSGITVDTNAFTIVPELQTAGLTWLSPIAYYRLTAADAGGVVTGIMNGTFTIE